MPNGFHGLGKTEVVDLKKSLFPDIFEAESPIGQNSALCSRIEKLMSFVRQVGLSLPSVVETFYAAYFKSQTTKADVLVSTQGFSVCKKTF